MKQATEVYENRRVKKGKRTFSFVVLILKMSCALDFQFFKPFWELSLVCVVAADSGTIAGAVELWRGQYWPRLPTLADVHAFRQVPRRGASKFDQTDDGTSSGNKSDPCLSDRKTNQHLVLRRTSRAHIWTWRRTNMSAARRSWNIRNCSSD